MSVNVSDLSVPGSWIVPGVVLGTGRASWLLEQEERGKALLGSGGDDGMVRVWGPSTDGSAWY